MESATADRGIAGEPVDFTLPDFLDLSGDDTGARFSCSSTAADGGVLVFADDLVLVSEGRSERVARAEVAYWSSRWDGALCVITVETGRGPLTARLYGPFARPAMTALEAFLGPATVVETLG